MVALHRAGMLGDDRIHERLQRTFCDMLQSERWNTRPAVSPLSAIAANTTLPTSPRERAVLDHAHPTHESPGSDR